MQKGEHNLKPMVWIVGSLLLGPLNKHGDPRSQKSSRTEKTAKSQASRLLENACADLAPARRPKICNRLE